ncbi:MAG: COP23 domain-containing protein [Pseudanabaenaceae cyanobacterium SKYGB_i_bin29]|nr:COP23 domain-containing protein [Pseudanabaenaceae cyanobacterium SKYG29]MDW8421047.1 COP23 domain-containing protein [Pseudanabaenaceae cyanobacterium SKYGB_i_bin29]
MKWASLAVAALTISTLNAQAQTVTTFHCISTKVQSSNAKEENVFATVARRGNRQTPPMILWRTTLGRFTPQERCKVVSDRLTEVVAQNNGKLSNLYLTYGRVDGEPVICHVPDKNGACNRRNMLFTLRPQDKGNEKKILEQMVSFSVTGTGSAVQQSGEQFYAAFGEEAEKMLETTAASTSTSSGI